jgi:hypothetical protein
MESPVEAPRIGVGKAVNPVSPIIRLLGPGDACVLDDVAPDVFDNAIDPRWTAELLADPRHHLAVAIMNDRVVGMASAVRYVHPDKASQFWINEESRWKDDPRISSKSREHPPGVPRL